MSPDRCARLNTKIYLNCETELGMMVDISYSPHAYQDLPAMHTHPSANSTVSIKIAPYKSAHGI